MCEFLLVSAACCGILLTFTACYREMPPDMPEFRAPVVTKDEVATAAEVKRDTGPGPVMVEAPVVEAAPEVAAPPPVVAAPTGMEAPPPAPPEAAPAAPSIVGTWRMVQMIDQTGQPQPMPPGASMTLTFSADGQITVQQQFGDMNNSETGSYTVSVDQITLTVDGEPKTGTYTVTATQLTIVIDEGTVVCERV